MRTGHPVFRLRCYICKKVLHFHLEPLLQPTTRPARCVAEQFRPPLAVAVPLADRERAARPGGGRAAARARIADPHQQGHGGLRRRVLARQVGADQRDLLRGLRAAHHAGERGPHHHVPDRARLRRHAGAQAALAADRNPPRTAFARLLARPACTLDRDRDRRRRCRTAGPGHGQGGRGALGLAGRGARAGLLERGNARTTTRCRTPRAGSRSRAGAMPC